VVADFYTMALNYRVSYTRIRANYTTISTCPPRTCVRTRGPFVLAAGHLVLHYKQRGNGRVEPRALDDGERCPTLPIRLLRFRFDHAVIHLWTLT